jgi:protein gp37
MEDTKIEWTATIAADGTKYPGMTLNPFWGCQRVSEGCDRCYAEAFAKRIGHGVRLPMIWGPPATTERKIASEGHMRQPAIWNATAARTGVRRKVFCASMADVFEDHPAVVEQRAKLFRIIEATPNLDWLLLTKRPQNMVRLAEAAGWRGRWPDHVWAGATMENQRRVDERAPVLLAVPARIHFVSYEPAVGAVDLTPWLGGKCVACRGEGGDPIRSGYGLDAGWTACGACNGSGRRPSLGWVIVGGESGHGARPFPMDWAMSVVTQCKAAQCKAAGVPVFCKQMGAHPVDSFGERVRFGDAAKGGKIDEWPEPLRVRQWPSTGAVR